MTLLPLLNLDMYIKFVAQFYRLSKLTYSFLYFEQIELNNLLLFY